MRKVIVGARVSMDGVMQAPSGPDEDPTTRFKLGGWWWPYSDEESGEEFDHLGLQALVFVGQHLRG